MQSVQLWTESHSVFPNLDHHGFFSRNVLEQNKFVQLDESNRDWTCDPRIVVLTTLEYVYSYYQWRIQDFPNGGKLFCQKWGAHILFSGKWWHANCKNLGLKWGGARLLAPFFSKITIFFE